ncbi:enoyl-CoA hydratase/isomerase family protein [Thermoflavifilum thermophilum]|uniref:Enoyl-CoA hydratase n=1 Tax=Thermoflavifilum thermophilum TaxID=1393122 RepID=A0A1I7NDT0_9BACT|nr:enoyl-CoA hydratase-related protein [Thermoflavifilum thermophilum]SFV32834.1 enoyl-CoA hydratase [Thermoflavifilum thermophilum]
MAYQTLLTEAREGIFMITINRPEKMNALNSTVMEELDLAVEEVLTRDDIGGAIITGSGDRAFVAGADIAGFQQLSTEEARALSIKGQALFASIEQAPKPFLAAINGYALGGGCELAMACHLRIASTRARLGQPEINLGLIPGYGGTQRLPRLMGLTRALYLMLTGDMITAEQAQAYGLILDVVQPEELLPKSLELMQKIISGPRHAIRHILHCTYLSMAGDQAGYEAEAQAFSECFATADAGEGIQAFLEKRKPRFQGK